MIIRLTATWPLQEYTFLQRNMDSALKCVVRFLNTLYVPIWCNDNDVSFFFFLSSPQKYQTCISVLC